MHAKGRAGVAIGILAFGSGGGHAFSRIKDQGWIREAPSRGCVPNQGQDRFHGQALYALYCTPYALLPAQQRRHPRIRPRPQYGRTELFRLSYSYSSAPSGATGVHRSHDRKVTVTVAQNQVRGATAPPTPRICRRRTAALACGGRASAARALEGAIWTCSGALALWSSERRWSAVQ